MRLHPAIATAALTATVLLSACATPAPTGTNGPPATQAEETPLPTEPTLRIPETAPRGDMVAEVSAGDVDGPTDATLYGYRLEHFDTEENTEGLSTDCAAEPSTSLDFSLPANGQWSSVPVGVTPGRYMWVLTVGDRSTPCGEEAPISTVLLDPELSVRDGDVQPTAGTAFTVDVEANRMPATLPIDVELIVTGPWPSQPAATAAGCDVEADDAQVFTVEVTDDTFRVPFDVTLDEPGVYAMVAYAAESEQTSAASSCDGSSGSATLIAVS